jgi:hypothetical protein
MNTGGARPIRRLAALGALALVTVLPLAGCGPEQLSSLPIQAPGTQATAAPSPTVATMTSRAATAPANPPARKPAAPAASTSASTDPCRGNDREDPTEAGQAPPTSCPPTEVLPSPAPTPTPEPEPEPAPAPPLAPSP